MKNRLLAKYRKLIEKFSLIPGIIGQNEEIKLPSSILQGTVKLSVFHYRGRFWSPRPALLLLNDGQDSEALQLVETLDDLFQKRAIGPILVVAIHARDRMQEYGTAVRPDYAGRGSKATAYTQFIIEELLPYLQDNYRPSQNPALRAFAGFSLGGLSAIDIVWNHPQFFHKVGVFSGALWWRSTDFDPQKPDADRIMHESIARGKHYPGLRFWLQTGTHDETADRNNNGVIDAIDDTLDLIAALKKLGYTEGEDITYLEVEKGEHNVATWRKVMPEFLKWAF